MKTVENGIISVNWAELWDLIGGSTRFTADEIIEQMGQSYLAQESFYIQSATQRYVITMEDLSDYFATHPAPERRKTLQEEINALKGIIEAQKREIVALRASQVASKAIPGSYADVFHINPKPLFGIPDKVEPGGIIPQDTLVSPGELNPKVESFEDITKDLKEKLAGKARIINRPK